MVRKRRQNNYGVLLYDDDGLPICHFCGLSFHRLGAHVRMSHHMTAADYKIEWGLLRSKGLISKESAELAKQRALENYDRAVQGNLIRKGAKTRYPKGHKGRTKDMMSEQGLRLLQAHARTNMGSSERVELGRKLGKSGLGNKARWKLG